MTKILIEIVLSNDLVNIFFSVLLGERRIPRGVFLLSGRDPCGWHSFKGPSLLDWVDRHQIWRYPDDRERRTKVIGLSGFWIWEESRGEAQYTNWSHGQPDNSLGAGWSTLIGPDPRDTVLSLVEPYFAPLCFRIRRRGLCREMAVAFGEHCLPSVERFQLWWNRTRSLCFMSSTKIIEGQKDHPFPILYLSKNFMIIRNWKRQIVEINI